MLKRTFIYFTILFFGITDFALSAPPDVKFYYKYPYAGGIPYNTYRYRRDKLIKKIPANSAVIIFSSEFYTNLRDEYYINKKNDNYFYLTGSEGLKSALVLIPGGYSDGGENFTEILFYHGDLSSVQWNGPSIGRDFLKDSLKIQKTIKMDHFNDKIKDILRNTETLYVSEFPKLKGLPQNETDKPNPAILGKIMGSLPGLTLKYPVPHLSEMRRIKDKYETELIKKAVDISISAHIKTISGAKPGMYEYTLRGIMEGTFTELGAEHPAYPSIVGAGANGCILHYHDGRDFIKQGEMVLMDCGAEYHGYASDITRTFPISGKFTDEQRILYNLVLAAHDSVIAACRPGMDFFEGDLIAQKVLGDGLQKLGIISGPEELRKYYPHGTSHYLGLDVHDAGGFGKLEPGCVITVEPGIYIPAGSPCDKKWWNTGIRIEDDILITPEGAINLSAELPVKAEDIESLMIK